MARRGLPTLVALACLAAAGCSPAQPPPSPSAGTPPPSLGPTSQPTDPATTPEPRDRPARIADIDGDDVADLVAVDPGSPADGSGEAREGSVQVVLASGPSQRLGMSELGLQWSESSRFGAGRLVTDLNSDGYADLVVSDPMAGGSHGAIYALWGGPQGLDPGRFATLAVGADGSFTGWSMALVTEPSRVLALGTQHATGGGVALYPVADDGTLGEPALVDLDSPGIPGGRTKQNEFGSALAASGNLLAVGDPGATIDKAARAGAVTLLWLNEAGYTAERISEATEGVKGGPEADDEFGWSVSVHQGLLAIGVPGEAQGDLEQAGRVYLFEVSGTSVKTLQYLNQNSEGVAGTAEAGDRFGESVTVFRPCDGALGVLVGAPGETAGDDPQGAGAVQTLRVSRAQCTSVIALSETTAGLPSPPLAADGAVTVLRQNPDSDAAEPIAAVLTGGGAVVLQPPFTQISERFDVSGQLAAPLG